jgi:KRAB domain-containing zinc finger protein
MNPYINQPSPVTGCNHSNAIEKCQNYVPIECDLCSITFATRSELEAHDNVFHTHPFYCDICNKGFHSKWMCNAHRLTHFHLQLQCPLCPNIYKSNETLNVHIANSHSSIPKFKCVLCSQTFATRSKLFLHRRNQHVNVKCDSCNETFDTNLHYLRHVQTKHSDVPKLQNKIKHYKCNICPFVTDNKSRMTGHKRIKHEKPHKCLYCMKNFGTLSTLKHHIRSRHLSCNSLDNFSCYFCERTFIDKSDIEAHIIGAHLKEYENYPFLFAFYNNLVCKICHQLFESGSSLKTHSEQTHSNASICNVCCKQFVNLLNFKIHSRKCVSKVEYQCEFCGISMLDKFGLRIHIESTHLLQEYKCQVCPVILSSFCGLVVHFKMMHPSSRPMEFNENDIKCEYCGTKFKTNSRVKLHLRIHERAYFCRICGRRYGENSSLTAHKLLHKNPVTHSCTCCGRKFLSKKTVERHILMHRQNPCNGTNFRCDICDKLCKSIGGLTTHKRKMHGDGASKNNQKRIIYCKLCKLDFKTERLFLRHKKNVHDS